MAGLRDAGHIADVETYAVLVRAGAHVVADLPDHRDDTRAHKPVAARDVRRLEWGGFVRGKDWPVESHLSVCPYGSEAVKCIGPVQRTREMWAA